MRRRNPRQSTAHLPRINARVESLERRKLLAVSVAATSTDLALNRPTTASSIQNGGYLAPYATDASTSTRWSSVFGDNQWIEVDLGKSYVVNEVKLTWETAYGKAYKIQVSSDGTSWADAYNTTTGDGGTDDLTGLSAAGRYVRMFGVTRGTPWGFSLFDFEVFGNAPVQSATGLLGSYYNDTTLYGTAITRIDPTVNFNWGQGTPMSGIGVDNFSARWTGQVTPAVTQLYTFYTDSDDGARLWVNNQLLVDNWIPHGLTENSGTIALTAGHAYDIRLEYFELGGGAVAKLLWSAPTITKQAVPSSVLTPTSPPATNSGLLGSYFNDTTLTGAPLARTDPGVNFTWSGGTPIAGIGVNYFSVRWTGLIMPTVTQAYTFYTDSDDGVRLWVNHQLLIDNWTSHALTENAGSITLTAGQAYDIQLEYFQANGGAVVKLMWSTPAMPKQAVPVSVLTPAAQDLQSELDHAVAFAGSQVTATITSLLASPGAYTMYPQFTQTANNKTTWSTVDGNSWAAGFWPGQMWMLYSLTGNFYWKTEASAWTTGPSMRVTSGATDDLWGTFDNYLARYQATGNAADLQLILQAASQKLSAWNSTVQAFGSSGRTSTSGNPKADFGVLMDQTMDLPMVLFAAQQTGNTAAVNDVITHVLTLGQTLVRADGSTAQWGYFDSTTGQYIGPEAYQGYSSSSAWARGQAWAIHAFSEIARLTGSADILALAEKVADFWVAHLPADGVPYWDFNAPSPTYKDSSAGAIAASGLIDLSQQLKAANPAVSKKYMASAEQTLTSLAGPGYLAEGTGNPGIILHGSTFVPLNPPIADTGMSTTDYYFLQAVSRYRAPVVTGNGILTVSGTNVTLGTTPAGGVRTIIDGTTTDYAAGQWGAVHYKSTADYQSLTVLATVVPTEISGGSLSTATIGDPAVGVQNILAPITTDPAAINLPVTVSDAGDTQARIITVARASDGSSDILHGLAPADIVLQLSNASIVNGSGSDTISVPSTAVGNIRWSNTGGTDHFTLGDGTLRNLWASMLISATGGDNSVNLDASNSIDGLHLQSPSSFLLPPAGANLDDYSQVQYTVDPNAYIYDNQQTISFQSATTSSLTYTDSHQPTDEGTRFTVSTSGGDQKGTLPASVTFNGDGNDDVTIDGRNPSTHFTITSNRLALYTFDGTANGQVNFTGISSSTTKSSLLINAASAGAVLAHDRFTVGNSLVNFSGINELDLGGLTGSYLTLNYTPGNFNVFPAVVNLHSVWGMQGLPSSGDPLAGTTLTIGNRFFLNYAPSQGSAMQLLVRKYLAAGVIGTDNIHQSGLTIGYANQADGVVPGLPTNSIELYDTKFGDVNLDGHVTQADLALLQSHLGQAGFWDGGDLNYDGIVDSTDLAILQMYLGT